MKMKKLIVLSLVLFMSLGSFADDNDDYTLYIVATSSQQPTEHKLADIQKLTFENGNLVVNLKNGTKESTAISVVSRMYFSLLSAVAEDINGDGRVDTQDVLKIYEYMQTSSTPDGASEDVNKDGRVDTQDVLKVYDYIQSH
jgi:SUMO ligase MMS21 Smc5/6 complex component